MDSIRFDDYDEFEERMLSIGATKQQIKNWADRIMWGWITRNRTALISVVYEMRAVRTKHENNIKKEES